MWGTVGSWRTGSGPAWFRVTRQGEELFSGPEIEGYFFDEALHKEFVLETTEDGEIQRNLVYIKGSDMCGVGLFTRKELTCSKLPVQVVNAEMKSMAKLEPATDRGFGLEFEFVARDVEEIDANVDAIRLNVKKSAHVELFLALLREMLGRMPFGDNGQKIKAGKLKEAARAVVDKHTHMFAHYLASKGVQRMIEEGEVEQDVQRILNDYFKIPTVKSCFDDAARDPSLINQTCMGDKDCALTQFCHQGSCQLRSDCVNLTSSKENCPMPLKEWTWTSDVTVRPLTEEEVLQHDEADVGETEGVGFELVSPILSGERGFRSSQEILSLLRHLGLQAGPSSGLHMHVNALGNAPGDKLSLRGVAHVWAAWAKYQLVIDEMLSPNRLGNAWTRRFFIKEKCPPVLDEHDNELTRCNDNPCPCIQSMFSQMHAVLKESDLEDMSEVDFCNRVLARPDLELPCNTQYPHQRYFGLNLVPIAKYGTVEFRVHSATYDGERVARWSQFLIAFVERFGNPAHGNGPMATYFDGEDWQEDFAELGKAQRNATMSDLFKDLGDMVDPTTHKYYESREWELDDQACVPPKEDSDESATSAGSAVDPEAVKSNEVENLLHEIGALAFNLPSLE